MKFEGCYCTTLYCWKKIEPGDAEPWITRGICANCRGRGEPGVPMSKADLSADDLEYARLNGFPIYCQKMRRRSRVKAKEWVYSDVEELTPEALNKQVGELCALGWVKERTDFVRRKTDGC